MIWAQIKNGIVINCIVLDDLSLVSVFSEGYDTFIQVDALSPRPHPQWTYDGNNFFPPAPGQIRVVQQEVAENRALNQSILQQFLVDINNIAEATNQFLIDIIPMLTLLQAGLLDPAADLLDALTGYAFLDAPYDAPDGPSFREHYVAVMKDDSSP